MQHLKNTFTQKKKRAEVIKTYSTVQSLELKSLMYQIDNFNKRGDSQMIPVNLIFSNQEEMSMLRLEYCSGKGGTGVFLSCREILYSEQIPSLSGEVLKDQNQRRVSTTQVRVNITT